MMGEAASRAVEIVQQADRPLTWREVHVMLTDDGYQVAPRSTYRALLRAERRGLLRRLPTSFAEPLIRWEPNHEG